MSEKQRFRIYASYDTETTNLAIEGGHSAFVSLYIVADVRNVDMRRYEDGAERILFYRYPEQMFAYIEEAIEYGTRYGFVPIICAYNLLFDLQTLLYKLAQSYKLKVCAQSATHVYYLDVYDGDRHVMRFWDMYYLDMRGLAAMGDVCGVEKLRGAWDYARLRTPETELTADEEAYAAHDVKILLAYIRYMLEANSWLTLDMLGQSLLTKTGLVRQRALNEDYSLRRDGRRATIGAMFERMCMAELPKRYVDYTLRKACFRGGLTFTSARYASCELHNVYSLDAVSMHHAFINGRYVPERFCPQPPRSLQRAAETVLATPIEQVLASYHKPFRVAFHVRVRFTNLRLRPDTLWSFYHIGTIAEGKFRASSLTDGDLAAKYAEEVARASLHDSAQGAIMAYGKLMSARVCTLHLCEVELYVLGLAYEWDTMDCIFGEATMSFTRPPDYVTLQSNELYKLKDELKCVVKGYQQGVPYVGVLPESVPEGLCALMRVGELSEQALNGYYNSTVKGMYNGIYGTQAQDIYKPEYMVDRQGGISVDRETAVTRETWEARQPKRCRVLYTYGMRIVAGSRLHLALAMTLIYRRFGERAIISGGDTDSMKVACDGVKPAQLISALHPLHDAMDKAVATTQERVRKHWPDHCADFAQLGHFEVENEHPYTAHVELWNKARASLDANGAPHVTCAGLSRPKGYNIEDAIADTMADGWGFGEAVELCMGWNATIDSAICGMLQHTHPEPWERVETTVTDWRGDTYTVDLPAAIALYPEARTLGEVEKPANARSVRYSMELGVMPTTYPRYVSYDGSLKVERI